MKTLLEGITSACMNAAICTSVDDHDRPLDMLGADLALSVRSKFMEGAASFYNENRADCNAFIRDYGTEQLGHDLFLTAQGHGSGFWDRGAGDLGERLTAASKRSMFTHMALYIDDEHKIQCD